MTDKTDHLEHERALVDARREGAIAARKQAITIVLVVLAVFAATLGYGWTLASRAQRAAPEIIEEIASERRAAMEARLLARSQEASALAGEVFGFLHRVWQENEALKQVRANVQAATNELRLLTQEVNAAFDSPTTQLAPLLENGPTRAAAVLQHGLAVAKELEKLVPAVMGALSQARQAVDGERDEPAVPAVLEAMEALLAPFIGTNSELRTQWVTLKTKVLTWVETVFDDFEVARQEMSGDELSDEFMRRLRDRIF